MQLAQASQGSVSIAQCNISWGAGPLQTGIYQRYLRRGTSCIY